MRRDTLIRLNGSVIFVEKVIYIMMTFQKKECMDTLFEDIVQGKVNSLNNHCCRKNIAPDKLAYVDLSPILPRKIIKRDNKVVEEDFER